MPDPSREATTAPPHRARQNDDLTPKRTQTSKTTVGIAINRVSTHPPDEADIPPMEPIDEKIVVFASSYSLEVL